MISNRVIVHFNIERPYLIKCLECQNFNLILNMLLTHFIRFEAFSYTFKMLRDYMV